MARPARVSASCSTENVGPEAGIPDLKFENTFRRFNLYRPTDLADTHGSWIGSIKNPIMVAATGWFRVHLMGDTANRKMFYGPSCTLCTDTQHWDIERKGMDQ